MFRCKKCGQCCRHLNLSELYSDLDRGDGVCKYLKDNLCSIYSDRPLKCRIDECYEMFFLDLMSRENFYQINHTVCQSFEEER